MAPEHPAIRVQLVDDDVFEVLEELGPPWMVRQDARMHHVWIAEHQMGSGSDAAPRILRSIAVVGEDADLFAALGRQRFTEALELGQLILRKRLGRKEIQCAARMILEHRLQDGRVVAERLP